MTGRLIMGALFGIAASTMAVAQTPNCALRDDLAKALLEQHGERPVARGVTDNGRAMIEVFAAADGSSFTVIKVIPAGIACMVEAGAGWHPVEATVTDPSS